jgi:uncharacterized protein YecT (DUF1311 family)
MKRSAATALAVLFTCLAPTVASADDADAALNANYKALLGRLDDGNAGRLRDAQRAWIAFRDKECAFKAQGHDDAALAKTSHDTCIEALTQQRADQLKSELDCDAEDVGCVPRKAAAAAAPAAGPGTDCRTEVGSTKAERYVAQCQQVSPATHPPCNVANPCNLMIDEIRRSCAMLDKGAPAFCADYR